MSKMDKDELNNNVLPRCRSLEFLDEQKQPSDELASRIARDNLYQSVDLVGSDVQYRVEVHSSQNAVDVGALRSSTKFSDANTSDSSKMLMKQIANQRHMQLGPPQEFGMNYGPRAICAKAFPVNRSSRKSSVEPTSTVSMHRSDTDSSHSRARYPIDDSSKQCSLKKLYRLPYKYPNDFDDISVEMENITKLLGSTIDLKRYADTTPSTCSSACHSRLQAATAQIDSNDRSDAEISTNNRNSKLPFSPPYDTALTPSNMPNGNGIFKNPW